jgi:cellulose synthase/poly-beta-1,6-N-acetylglucosamine synthase-like glycosyltransferase
MRLFRWLVFAAWLWLGAGMVYHYFLLLVGRRRPESEMRKPASQHRLAIVLPAHNEEAVIGATVHNLAAQHYPRALFDIHVVADHCQDRTAEMARHAGAEVHLRITGARGRKGYALAWLLGRLLTDARGYDAFVVFDADSRPAPDCLAKLQQALAQGSVAIQGRHVIANPAESIFASLADADMRLNNRIRNQAKANLGLSARLMGDGMVFSRELLARQPWTGEDSLTEDRDYGLHLVTQGEQVAYAPGAISYGQATTDWQSATPQRMRWYGGAFALQKKYLKPLLIRCVRRHDVDALDKLLELSLPPYSLMAVATPALWLVQRLFGVGPGAAPLLVGVVWGYPALGLIAERAPASAFRSLAFGPVYVLWRVSISVRVRLQRTPIRWQRTAHR